MTFSDQNQLYPMKEKIMKWYIWILIVIVIAAFIKIIFG